jgi:hypothetical protein
MFLRIVDRWRNVGADGDTSDDPCVDLVSLTTKFNNGVRDPHVEIECDQAFLDALKAESPEALSPVEETGAWHEGHVGFFQGVPVMLVKG